MTIIVPAVAVLLGAVAGGVFTTVAAGQSSNAQLQLQQQQVVAQNSDRERQTRVDAYTRFLQAAEDSARDGSTEDLCRQISPERRKLVSSCTNEDQTSAESQLRLQEAGSQIEIYGSDQAVQISRSIISGTTRRQQDGLVQEAAITECAGLGPTGLPGVGPRCDALRAIADASARASGGAPVTGSPAELSDQFKVTMCRELNAVPRPRCD